MAPLSLCLCRPLQGIVGPSIPCFGGQVGIFAVFVQKPLKNTTIICLFVKQSGESSVHELGKEVNPVAKHEA